MGFWDYEASSDDEDVDIAAEQVLRNKQENQSVPSHEMDARNSSAKPGEKKSLVELESSDDEDTKKDIQSHALTINFDDIEAEIAEKSSKKRKRKGSATGKSPAKGARKSPKNGKGKSPGKTGCAVNSEAQEAENLQRIEAVRKKAKRAFAVEDDDDDDESEAVDLCSEPTPPRIRAPVKPVQRPEEEEDIDAALEEERQEILQSGQVSGIDAAGESAGETFVLRVKCKHGDVQIRQRKDDNFATLHKKFKEYAIEQKWATKSTNIFLTCDDDDVDIETNTPDDFDLEDGMVVDAVMK